MLRRPTPRFAAPLFSLCGHHRAAEELLSVMKAFAALPVALRKEAPLLLAGPWGWRSEAEFEFYETIGRDARHSPSGVMSPMAAPCRLSIRAASPPCIRRCTTGFGLPPLEAVASR